MVFLYMNEMGRPRAHLSAQTYKGVFVRQSKIGYCFVCKRSIRKNDKSLTISAATDSSSEQRMLCEKHFPKDGESKSDK